MVLSWKVGTWCSMAKAQNVSIPNASAVIIFLKGNLRLLSQVDAELLEIIIPKLQILPDKDILDFMTSLCCHYC